MAPRLVKGVDFEVDWQYVGHEASREKWWQSMGLGEHSEIQQVHMSMQSCSKVLALGLSRVYFISNSTCIFVIIIVSWFLLEFEKKFFFSRALALFFQL